MLGQWFVLWSHRLHGSYSSHSNGDPYPKTDKECIVLGRPLSVWNQRRQTVSRWGTLKSQICSGNSCERVVSERQSNVQISPQHVSLYSTALATGSLKMSVIVVGARVILFCFSSQFPKPPEMAWQKKRRRFQLLGLCASPWEMHEGHREGSHFDFLEEAKVERPQDGRDMGLPACNGVYVHQTG